MITVHNLEQGTPEWLELRNNLYTGTGAEKLLSYSGHVKVVNGVVSSYALSEITGFKGNFYTDRGHTLEEEAIELYQAITHHEITRPGFVTNDLYPECGFSPDGFDVDLDRPLEVKCFNQEKHMKMFKGDIPLKILAQIYFGMFIWEKKGARLIIYNPDLDAQYALKIIDIPERTGVIKNFKRILLKGEPSAS